jgi:hypothetical protein
LFLPEPVPHYKTFCLLPILLLLEGGLPLVTLLKKDIQNTPYLFQVLTLPPIHNVPDVSAELDVVLRPLEGKSLDLLHVVVIPLAADVVDKSGHMARDWVVWVTQIDVVHSQVHFPVQRVFNKAGTGGV